MDVISFGALAFFRATMILDDFGLKCKLIHNTQTWRHWNYIYNYIYIIYSIGMSRRIRRHRFWLSIMMHVELSPPQADNIILSYIINENDIQRNQITYDHMYFIDSNFITSLSENSRLSKVQLWPTVPRAGRSRAACSLACLKGSWKPTKCVSRRKLAVCCPEKVVWWCLMSVFWWIRLN